MTPDLSAYPLVLSVGHMAEIFGVGQEAIRIRVNRGTFPIPRLERETRLAWSRSSVQAFFAAETFAATNRRTA